MVSSPRRDAPHANRFRVQEPLVDQLLARPPDTVGPHRCPSFGIASQFIFLGQFWEISFYPCGGFLNREFSTCVVDDPQQGKAYRSRYRDCHLYTPFEGPSSNKNFALRLDRPLANPAGSRQGRSRDTVRSVPNESQRFCRRRALDSGLVDRLGHALIGERRLRRVDSGLADSVVTG